jgi:hypothetical protein
MELFMLFDLGRWRDKEATYCLDPSSQARATKRTMSAKVKRARVGRAQRRVKHEVNCTTRASLGIELVNFKTIVRNILSNNASEAHQRMFLLDHRTHIRRLKPFAIIGHQPGFNAIRVTTEDERRQLERAIMRQRVGTTSKQALAMMRSVHERRDEGEECSFKLKRAKLDTHSVPLWTRTYRETPILPVVVSMPYTSRMLCCRACGHAKETAHMQLKMASGYRGICCPGCHKQARVTQNLCQCNVIWHQCPTHRHDPPVHRSEKPAASGVAARPKKVKDKLSLHRVAPEALTRKPTKRRKTERQGSEHRLHSHGQAASSATTTAPRLDPTQQPMLAARFPHLSTRRGNE